MLALSARTQRDQLAATQELVDVVRHALLTVRTTSSYEQPDEARRKTNAETIRKADRKVWASAHGIYLPPERLHPAILRTIREWFELVDDDGSGTLEHEELMAALTAARVPCSPESIWEMIALMDARKAGSIAWDDFERFLRAEIAAGKQLLSGEYVLPSGLALPFGVMIAKLKRDNMIQEIMKGGPDRVKWLRRSAAADLRAEVADLEAAEAALAEERAAKTSLGGAGVSSGGATHRSSSGLGAAGLLAASQAVVAALQTVERGQQPGMQMQSIAEAPQGAVPPADAPVVGSVGLLRLLGTPRARPHAAPRGGQAPLLSQTRAAAATAPGAGDAHGTARPSSVPRLALDRLAASMPGEASPGSWSARDSATWGRLPASIRSSFPAADGTGAGSPRGGGLPASGRSSPAHSMRSPGASAAATGASAAAGCTTSSPCASHGRPLGPLAAAAAAAHQDAAWDARAAASLARGLASQLTACGGEQAQPDDGPAAAAAAAVPRLRLSDLALAAGAVGSSPHPAGSARVQSQPGTARLLASVRIVQASPHYLNTPASARLVPPGRLLGTSGSTAQGGTLARSGGHGAGTRAAALHATPKAPPAGAAKRQGPRQQQVVRARGPAGQGGQLLDSMRGAGGGKLLGSPRPAARPWL